MKEKIINIKEKIFTFIQKMAREIVRIFKKIKNIVVPFVVTNKKIIIFTISGIVLLTAIVLGIFALNKEERGNTSGNLDNLGFVVKNKGWVYYIGYNNGVNDGIYKIKGNKNEKISDDYALYLNKSGTHIYYIDAKEQDIVRIKTNGKDKETVVQDVDIEKITIVDDWIYFFENTKLCKIKTNGKDKQVILEKNIENYEVNGNWIYYSYKNDGKYVISKIKANEEEKTKVDENLGAIFFIDGKNIYYIYENYKENEYSYELYKVKLNGKNKEKIVDLPKNIFISSINFNKDEIYYIKENEEAKLAIYKMSLKGNETKIVDVNGYVTYINIIDNWIYYPDINDQGNDTMYRIKTNGEERESLCK